MKQPIIPDLENVILFDPKAFRNIIRSTFRHRHHAEQFVQAYLKQGYRYLYLKQDSTTEKFLFWTREVPLWEVCVGLPGDTEEKINLHFS